MGACYMQVHVSAIEDCAGAQASSGGSAAGPLERTIALQVRFTLLA